MGKPKDLAGMKFGKLLVIEVKNKDFDKKHKRWLCKCDCGNEKVVRQECLLRGKTKSCGCYRRSLEAKASKKSVFDSYKQSAKRKGLEFCLSEELFFEITSKDCFYCGIKPSNLEKSRSGKEDFYYNGIDRLDSKKGYIESNVAPCCWKCNQAKSRMSVNDFYEWSDRLYEHRHKTIAK